MLFQNKYRVEPARLTHWDYSSNGYYYITICTHNRECLLGDIIDGKMQLSAIGEIVLQGWNDSFAMREELSCDRFVIMPNHIHGIVIIRKPVDNSTVETHGGASLPNADNPTETHSRASLQGGMNIGNMETYSRTSLPYRMPKSISSFIAGFKSAVTKRINEIRQTPGVAVWQSRFYDHIIRNEESLHKIRQYIVNNPMSWHTDELNPSSVETHGHASSLPNETHSRASLH
jgi:REP element-mobilizing transposase RayT